MDRDFRGKVLLMKIQQLSTAEKIVLAEEIWESVRADEDSVPITDEQRTELDKRLSAYELDGKLGASWESVKSRISK